MTVSGAPSGIPGVPPATVPDYRMSLAAERTYLAYLRTALALSAGGVAVVGAFPGAGALGLRRGIGIILVSLGIAVAATARLRWIEVERAMRAGAELPAARVTLLLAVGVCGAATAGLVAVLLM